MKHFLLFILGFAWMTVNAQAEPDSTFSVHEFVIVDGDTIPCVTLGTAEIDYLSGFERNAKFYRKYDRLKRRVIEMYPYAQTAGELMVEYEANLDNLPTRRDRKRYLNEAEKELKAQFEGEIRNMSIRDGAVLIKLIDRQTGSTSYEVIQELKGNFSAFVWQGVARIFGSNLKADYNPELEDAMIEDIVQRIERGELEVAQR